MPKDPELFQLTPADPRPINLNDLRLAKSLGVIDAFMRDGTCTNCGWPRHGVIHQDTCEHKRRAHKAQPAPTQPWQPRPARLRAA